MQEACYVGAAKCTAVQCYKQQCTIQPAMQVLLPPPSMGLQIGNKPAPKSGCDAYVTRRPLWL